MRVPTYARPGHPERQALLAAVAHLALAVTSVLAALYLATH